MVAREGDPPARATTDSRAASGRRFLFELFCDLCAQAIFHTPGIFSFFVEYSSQSCLYDDQLSFVPPKTEP